MIYKCKVCGKIDETPSKKYHITNKKRCYGLYESVSLGVNEKSDVVPYYRKVREVFLRKNK